jgi:hypothetical protein
MWLLKIDYDRFFIPNQFEKWQVCENARWWSLKRGRLEAVVAGTWRPIAA